MRSSAYLGELEQMVLLAILQLGEQAFGTSVMDELKRRVDRKVSRGALYDEHNARVEWAEAQLALVETWPPGRRGGTRGGEHE